MGSSRGDETEIVVALTLMNLLAVLGAHRHDYHLYSEEEEGGLSEETRSISLGRGTYTQWERCFRQLLDAL